MNDLGTWTPERAAIAVLTPERRPERASRVVWQETFDVAGPDGAIACWRSGMGPVVLIVHGWEATHVDGDAFVEPLLDAGYRVVTFDLPAHGASAGTIASIPDLAEAVVRVAAHVGPLDAIVAHSIGCAATSVALERGLDVRRVVFIAPPERFSNVIAELGKQANLDPLAIEAVLLERGLDVPKLDLPKSAVAFAQPVLIVHSADDRVVSVEGARRTARAWRGSELLEVEGLGHNRILRDPAVVRTAIEFIAR